MGYTLDDFHADKVDFSDAIDPEAPTAGPIHPGYVLRTEFLEPLGLSVYAVADAIDVPRSRLNDIVRERRSVTADTALRLGRYFRTTPTLWLNLQARYDLEVAFAKLDPGFADRVRPYAPKAA